jgi:enamine deaminase RidA (YjgF/YER057c/UK114 family)
VIERINPPGLHAPPGYHHVTITDARRVAHLAGQCPIDGQGQLAAPGDVLGQTRQVAANIAAVLDSVGAGPDDVIRTVIYVVPSRQGDLAAVWQVLRESPIAAAFSTASTLLGVTQLGFTGQLVEIDVTAVLPDR